MAKDLEISFLLDFYGDMLTEKQREVIEFYYNEDLSLSEIADNEGITRQGVRDSIKRAEAQLLQKQIRLDMIQLAAEWHQLPRVQRAHIHPQIICEGQRRLLCSLPSPAPQPRGTGFPQSAASDLPDFADMRGS